MSDFSFAAVARGMQDDTQPSEVEPVVEQTVSESTEVASDIVSPVISSEPADVEPLAEQPSTQLFSAQMRSRGYDVPDDTDEVALIDSALERISASAAAFSRLQQLEAELAALKNAPPPAAPSPIVAAAPPPPEPPAVQPEQHRHFRELQRYEATLEQFVTRDGQGNAVPKTEYGIPAIEAANKINEYERMERDQAARILQNPYLITDGLEQKFLTKAEAEAQMRAIVQEQVRLDREEQARRAQEMTVAQQAAEQERKALEWHEANKGKLFKLAANGEPMKMPFDDSQFMFTPMGVKFREKLSTLQSRYPGASRIDLMNDALEYASLAAPQPAAPVATPAQQRQMFSTQRTPHSNPPAATVSELSSTGQKLGFAALARANPETAEIIANWQKH